MRHAFFLLSSSPVPPPADAQWTPIELPDLWRAQRPDADGWGWYRFELPDPDTGVSLWSIGLLGASSHANIYVNGDAVRRILLPGKPKDRSWNHPILVTFSSKLLSPEGNTLDVQVHTHRGSAGGLASAEVGPAGSVAAHFEYESFRRVTLAQMGSALGIGLGLFIVLVWASSRQAIYGLFLIAMALWTVTSFGFHLRDIPLAFWTWQWTVNFSIDAFAVTVVLITHRLLRVRRPQLELALGAFLAVSGIGLAIAGPMEFERIAAAIRLVSLGTAIYVFVIIAARLVRYRIPILAALLLESVIWLALLTHHVMIQWAVVPIETPPLLRFGGWLMLLAFSTTVTSRLVRGRRLTTSLSRTLDEAREWQQQREVGFEQRSAVDRKRVLETERTRMMREMHDSLGSQLVSTLAMVDGGESEPAAVASALRESLADLRLVVRSLDSSEQSLNVLLAELRARIAPRLQSLELIWRVGELPPGPDFTPERSLHVVRIVQEAITNAVRHGAPHRITVAAGAEVDVVGAPGLRIRVVDDGRGFDPKHVGGGHGRQNMCARAEAVGGQLRIDSGATGTTVELWIPRPVVASP